MKSMTPIDFSERDEECAHFAEKSE